MVLTGIFLKLHMCVYTYAVKFQVSSIILTSFRQGWGCPKNHAQCRIKRLIVLEKNVSPAVAYLLKVSHKNIRARCEICLNLTIKTPEQR